MSRPSFLTMWRTAGVDKAFELSEFYLLLPESETGTLTVCVEWDSCLCCAYYGLAACASASLVSSISIVRIGWPTAQIESLLKFICLTIPEAVEGIFATSLSVNTSQRSSYYLKIITM